MPGMWAGARCQVDVTAHSASMVVPGALLAWLPTRCGSLVTGPDKHRHHTGSTQPQHGYDSQTDS